MFSHHQWYFSEETVALEFSNKSIDTALKVASDFATEAYVRFCSKSCLIGMTVRGCRTAVNAVVNCGRHMPKSREWFCREQCGHGPETLHRGVGSMITILTEDDDQKQ